MEIQGAGAIVFGGASGLGEATARRLAAEGAHVVVADLAEERAEALAGEIGGVGVRTDVLDDASVADAVAAASEAPRGLRFSVVCAGLGTPAKLLGRDGATPFARFESVLCCWPTSAPTSCASSASTPRVAAARAGCSSTSSTARGAPSRST